MKIPSFLVNTIKMVDFPASYVSFREGNLSLHLTSYDSETNSWEPKVPPQGHVKPPRKGLIFGLIKGNQWVFIVPDHKAGYLLGGTLGSHERSLRAKNSTRIITFLGSGIPINLHFPVLLGGGHIQCIYIYIDIDPGFWGLQTDLTNPTVFWDPQNR